MKLSKILFVLVLAAAFVIPELAPAQKTTVTTWTRFPASGSIGTSTPSNTGGYSYGGGVYGAYVYATYRFTGRGDTAYFPIIIPRPFNATDTTGILCALQTITPTDSGDVAWSLQTSSDLVTWNTAIAYKKDSTATAGTQSLTINAGKAAGAWYQPYARWVAIGDGLLQAGHKSNKIGVIARVQLQNIP